MMCFASPCNCKEAVLATAQCMQIARRFIRTPFLDSLESIPHYFFPRYRKLSGSRKRLRKGKERKKVLLAQRASRVNTYNINRDGEWERKSERKEDVYRMSTRALG